MTRLSKPCFFMYHSMNPSDILNDSTETIFDLLAHNTTKFTLFKLNFI